MTTDNVMIESAHQQIEKETTNGADDSTVVTDSSLNACKGLSNITPIIITPLSINILQQLQKCEDSNNVIASLPSNPIATTTMISPSLLQHQGDKPKNLSQEEKRQRRLWRNRVAAKECRKKKKMYIHDMEETIQRLTNENGHLRNQVDELKAKVSSLPVLEENYRLMKEIEKLNAQLEG